MSEPALPTVRNPDDNVIRERFETKGYVIVEDAVPKDRIEQVKDEIEYILTAEASRHLDVDPTDSDRFDEHLEQLFNLDSDYRGRLYELLQDMHSLYHVGLCDEVINVADALGIDAPNVRNVGTRIDIPNENEYLQPLHQDVNNMKSEDCLNCWIPLQGVTPENGALRVFSESHELGPLGPEYKEFNENGYESIKQSVVDEYDEIHCTINAGDALFFHPYLVHGSETNNSDDIRWTNIIRYDNATEIEWLRDGENPFGELRLEETTGSND